MKIREFRDGTRCCYHARSFSAGLSSIGLMFDSAEKICSTTMYSSLCSLSTTYNLVCLYTYLD